VLAVGDECDPGEGLVMKANLSRFLHRRDEAYRPSSTDRVRSFGCSRGQTATGCPPAGAAGSGCRWPADRTPGCAGRMQLVHEVMAGRSSSRCLTNVVGDRHSDEPQPAEVAVRLRVLPLAWGSLGLPAVVGIVRGVRQPGLGPAAWTEPDVSDTLRGC
jgi:hypothetical protein